MDICIDDIKRKLTARRVGVIGKRKEYSVLIPLTEVDGELSFLFEVRSQDVRQPGDVCFPGGRVEEGETYKEAALRETEEEVGLPSGEIAILGQFDSLMEVNRIRMHTLVGAFPSGRLKELRTDGEVAEVFTVPLRFFTETEPDLYRGKIIQDTEGFPYEKHGIDPGYKWREAYQNVYFWHYGGHVIWGLTAEIVKWFCDEMLKEGPEVQNGR